MNDFPRFVNDDDDDTLAFKSWEEDVLRNCPNPQRIGCPGHDVLKTFVETPRKVGLAELHGNHITRCAECVRDLIELRHLREERLNQPAAVSSLFWRLGWRGALAVASLCVLVAVATMLWRGHAAHEKPLPQEESIAEITVDLSGDGVTRSSEGSPAEKLISLPRRPVDLHVILPYYSPAGEYRITLAQDRNSEPFRTQQTNAIAQGAHTELHVRLDLRGVTAGRYYLGTKHDGESATYFYQVAVS